MRKWECGRRKWEVGMRKSECGMRKAEVRRRNAAEFCVADNRLIIQNPVSAKKHKKI
jgi:hypothetical protein